MYRIRLVNKIDNTMLYYVEPVKTGRYSAVFYERSRMKKVIKEEATVFDNLEYCKMIIDTAVQTLSPKDKKKFYGEVIDD